ncbi:MAG: hypothetical protein P8J37_07365 [Fuerstiella sp.]|nr:hypothetical protein [Fuerstiella sp.]
MVIAIVAAIVMFLKLRKYEARLVSPGVSRILLTLRVLVLLVLLLTLMKPVLTRAWDVEHQERLVVGFDVSGSMETVDRHASPSEMLRWAQALGMLGNDSTNDLLETWISAYDAGQQPNWGASVNGTDPQDEGNADLGTIRRQHIEGVFAEFEKMPRTEVVRRLLLAKPNDLLAKLQDVQRVDVRVFGLDQQSVSADQLQGILDSDRKELRPGGTDAVSVLTEALGHDDGSNISSIVLLSDGRQTASVDALAEAARLGSLGIPVYCVPIGSQLLPRDLSVASVQVPQTVFLEDSAQMQATFTSTGYVGEDVTVNLEKDGEVIDQRTVTVAAGFFEVEFAIPSDEAGNFEYSVSTDVQRGESRDDNNSRDFTVSVVDNKARVLLVEGDARWEFRYLKSAMERDKRVEHSTVLFRQPFLQLLNRTFMDGDLPELEAFKEQLANTDIVIVGDVGPPHIAEPVFQAIETAVADDGVTLMIVPGRRHMPHNVHSPTLQRLLPITSPTQQVAERRKRTLPGAQPSVFRLKLTQEASDLTLFRFTDPDAEQPIGFANLPGHPWACTGQPKGIASVWATLQMEAVDLGTASVAAVVHQYYGFGQVVWMGVESTWRWRLRAGDRWHHRFWGQVVRWAARNKSAAGNDQVRMTLSDIIIDETEFVDVSVRWNPKLVPQLEDGTVEVIVDPVREPEPDDAAALFQPNDDADKASQKFQMHPIQGAPERYSVRIPRMEPGSYEVRLHVENSRIQLDQDINSELIVQEQVSTELANISCNRNFLEQLASLSSGRVLEPWQLSELPELLAPVDSAESVIQERTLWDHWILLLLFFILLTAEWVIRKINGLP